MTPKIGGSAQNKTCCIQTKIGIQNDYKLPNRIDYFLLDKKIKWGLGPQKGFKYLHNYMHTKQYTG
jgi:hypothetical protein